MTQKSASLRDEFEEELHNLTYRFDQVGLDAGHMVVAMEDQCRKLMTTLKAEAELLDPILPTEAELEQRTIKFSKQSAYKSFRDPN